MYWSVQAASPQKREALGAVLQDLELQESEHLFEAPQVERSESLRRKGKASVRGSVRFDVSDGYAMFGGRLGGGALGEAFFRDLDTTKQWAESH